MSPAFRIHGLGDLPDVARDLGVPPQVVNELGVRDPNSLSQTDPNRALAGGLVFFVHSYRANNVSKYVLSELPPSVDDQDLRKPAKSSHALPQRHHARAVTRRIECQIKGQGPPGECVCKRWSSMDGPEPGQC